jgi:hypothetical protein
LIEAALREVEAREQRKMHDAAEREEYIRVCREQPLTEEDFGWTTSPESLAHLREIPWDSGAAPCGGQISHTPGDGDPSS